MGWASGGDIFDPVAQALIDANIGDDKLRDVLCELVAALQDGDWDTESESLDKFADNLTIRSVFYDADVGGDFYDGVGEGRIRYVDGGWHLGCVDCGALAAQPFTAAGHDQLVRDWYAHDKDAHGGDGEVEKGMLIGDGETPPS